MTIPNDKFLLGLHTAQKEVFTAFDTRAKRFFLLKWHRRARKTTLLLNLLIRECIHYPNRIYPYIAPTYRQAKNIVWQDPTMLFSYLPDQGEMGWERNDTELYIRFANGSMLPIKGGDDPDSLRGMNAHGLGLDEWAQMKESVWTEIFRPIISEDSSRWAAFSYTPVGENHATELWRRSKDWPDWFQSELRASQSGLIPQEELDKARREMPPFLYEQEFECADITDEELTLITSKLIDGLRGYTLVRGYIKKLVSCDPDASLTGDECVIYYFENEAIKDEKVFHERDPKKIAHECQLMGRKHKTNNYVIDTIGVGLGVVSDLNTLGCNVIRFDSRQKAIKHEKFANVRAEAHWYVMEQMMNHEIPYPEDLLLRQDLTSVKVNPIGRFGKILLEPNLKTKARLGRSPDRGDTFVMGIYGLQFVAPEGEIEDIDDTGDTAMAKSYQTVSNF